MRLALWTNTPSPHQDDFLRALDAAGIDLQVRYQGAMAADRRRIGWGDAEQLAPFEAFVDPAGEPFATLPDWSDRVHIVPGYCRRFYRRLMPTLSAAGVPWAHWSEASQLSWRSALSWGMKRRHARLVNRHALGALAIGRNAEVDFGRWGVRSEKIAILPYAVDGVSSAAAPDPVVSEFLAGRRAFVFVGRFVELKMTDTLIRAFAAIRSPDWALVLVGGGPEEPRLRRLVQQLGVEDAVLFRGVLPVGQIENVLTAGAVFVLPSRYDGWGVALSEAASAGLALVATDCVGAAHHLIDPGVNGARIAARSVASLAGALGRYAASPTLAASHGRRSRELFQQVTPAANAQRLRTVLSGWLAGDARWRRWSADWPLDEAAPTTQLAA